MKLEFFCFFVFLTAWSLAMPASAVERHWKEAKRDFVVTNTTSLRVDDLDTSGNGADDVRIRFLGRETSSVRSVTLTLYREAAPSLKNVLSFPEPSPGNLKLQGPSWLLCGSAGATRVEIKVEWKEGATNNTLKGYIEKEDAFWRNEWIIRYDELEYRRLSWPAPTTGQNTTAVVVHSTDSVPAVVCLRYQCIKEDVLDTLSSDGDLCEEFERLANFRFPVVNGPPTYIYVQLMKPDDANGKEVNRIDVYQGSSRNVTAWLSRSENQPREKPKSRLTGHDKQQRGTEAVPVSPKGSGAGARSRRPLSVAGASGRPAASAGRSPSRQQPVPNSGPEARGRTGAHATGAHVSISDNSDRDVSASNTGSNNIHINVNSNVPANAAAPVAATERPPPPEATSRPPLTQSVPLGEDVRGVVSLSRPRLLQFQLTQQQQQGGLLRLELSTNDTVEALVHLASESKVLRVRADSGRQQLCPSQLVHGLLSVTVTAAAARPATFSARLSQPEDNELRLDAPEEVALAPDQSQVRQMTLHDWRSAAGLQVNTAPTTCLRVSVFRKLCAALAGRLKDAVLFKHVSGEQYLPLANAFKESRRAFLLTEPAAPERCGLSETDSARPALLSALLRLVQHEEPEVWLRLLLVPLLLTFGLPAFVMQLVRRAVTRLRRDSDDDGGVTISEVTADTPRLPRHVPRLTTTEGASGKKPALTAAESGDVTPRAGGSGASPARITVLSAAGYPDLSQEKRQQAGVVAGEPPAGSGQPGCSDLGTDCSESSQQKHQLAAETPAGEIDDQKGRLATQLGVGGEPAAPSAPPESADPEASTALLSSGCGDVAGRSAAAPRSAQDDSAAVVGLSSPGVQSVSGSWFVALSIMTVVPVTAYLSTASIQDLFSGDAGACPASPWYSLPSARGLGVGGLVNLVPTAASAVLLRWLRGNWAHHGPPALVRRRLMWPALGLEPVLLAYGIQAAIAGLCPRHTGFFTTNTFVVAFVGQLTASRVPGVGCHVPVAAAVLGSALVSASGWLPAPLALVAGAAAVVGHLALAAAVCCRLLLPKDIGRASVGLQLRLLKAGGAQWVMLAQLLVAVLGVTVLSPAGYLALAAISTLLSTSWITRYSKGTVTTPAVLSVFVVLAAASYSAAVIVGELAYHAVIGLLEESSIAGSLYIVSCVMFALGTVPRL